MPSNAELDARWERRKQRMYRKGEASFHERLANERRRYELATHPGERIDAGIAVMTMEGTPDHQMFQREGEWEREIHWATGEVVDFIPRIRAGIGDDWLRGFRMLG